MNNEELIAMFLKTHYEYKDGKDYLIVESDGYIIICVFHSYLMVHFNAWLAVNFNNGRRVLAHCTTSNPMYTKRYYSHMKKNYETPIKCFAFKKEKCVLDINCFDTTKYNPRDLAYSFDECTFWVSEGTKTKILKFHSRFNYVIYEEDERLAEGVFPINVLKIIAECSKLKSTKIKIQDDYDIDDFKKKEKKLKLKYEEKFTYL